MIKQDYLNQAEGNTEVLEWINTTLKAQVSKKEFVENQTEIEHIIDFLKSDKAPKRLRKMSYEQASRKAKDWTETLIKKAANIIETEEDVEVIKHWKTDNFKLVRLIGANAFKREGKLMRHCVGSYADKENVEVYSLRDANNNPHCTMEVNRSGNQVSQVKGKGNGPIHPKYIKYVLKALKKFGMEVRDSELENLGYLFLTKEEWEFIDSKFTDIKYLTFNNKKYLYKESKFTKRK